MGKSSLINALTGQQVSIVSEIPGTTTDPVEKTMELQPLGPVLLIDTAGLDDVGLLGSERVARSRSILDRLDLAVLIAEAGRWGEFEESTLEELRNRKVPAIVAFNKADLCAPDSALIASLGRLGVPAVPTVASTGLGIGPLRETLIRAAPEGWLEQRPILGDLIPLGAMVVLVVPIDIEAPRGRIILPQVQAIRDLLDHDAACVVVKENGLRQVLAALKQPPALVVTDSQAFAQVSKDVPQEIPLTSFSILFARYKGDLGTFVRGAVAIDDLRPGDRVLIAEACSHHPLEEDIGRVKIPKWLTAFVGGELKFSHAQGHGFPADLSSYRLVIHCGACMQNRREVLSRLERCVQAGVPVTNYGMAIARSLGILERALAPFPEALELYRQSRRAGPPCVAAMPSATL